MRLKLPSFSALALAGLAAVLLLLACQLSQEGRKCGTGDFQRSAIVDCHESSSDRLQRRGALEPCLDRSRCFSLSNNQPLPEDVGRRGNENGQNLRQRRAVLDKMMA